MGKAKEYNKDFKQHIVELHKSGLSLGDISRLLNIPRPSVQTIVDKFKTLGTIDSLPRSGRKRQLTPDAERKLVAIVELNPKTTKQQLCIDLETAGTRISPSTVKRVLHRHGLVRGCRASKKPPTYYVPFSSSTSQESQSRMPLKYAANLAFLFKEIPDLVGRYAAAKRVGFEAVEIAFPYEIPLETLVAAKEKEGVEQVLINSYPGDLKAGDFGLAALPGRVDEFKETLETSVKYCTALKCPRLHIIAGKVPECLAEERPMIMEKMEETYVSNLKYAADRLSKEGILALIEPINTIVSLPRYFLSRQDQGVDIIKKVDHTNLKLQMDLFHVQLVHGNITNTIQKYFQYIGHMQMAQVPNRNEPSGDGELNYDFIISYIEHLGYNGWMGAEYSPMSGVKTEDTLNWLKRYRRVQPTGQE